LFTQEHLEKDLKQIGLAKGDMVYVHTSLRAIGTIDGGADTLIDALKNVLGPDGTIAVPTHTLSFVGLGKPPHTSDTASVLGAFPEIFRKRAEALRSGHASHSTAAIGKHAKTLTENHAPCNALGKNSPLYRLWQTDGKILLLGVTHKANTSIHLAESLAKMPYVRLHYDASWGEAVHELLPDGTVKEHVQIEFPACSGMFNKLQAPLEAKGQCSVGQVGNATSYLMRSQDLITKAIELLEEDNFTLLCDDDNCPACPARKEFLTNSL